MSFLLRKFLKPFFWWFFLYTIVLIAREWLDLRIIAMMSAIVNEGILKQNFNFVWDQSCWRLFYTLIQSLLFIASFYLSNKITMELATAIEKEMLKKVLSFGKTEIRKFSVASLLTRTVNDVEQVSYFVMDFLRFVLMAIFVAIIASVQAAILAPDFIWILIVLPLLGFIITLVLTKIAHPKLKSYRKTSDDLTAIVRENIAGVKVIRAFNNESLEKQKLNATNTKLTKLAIAIDTIFAFDSPFSSLLLSAVSLLTMWLVATNVQADARLLGISFAFIQYAVSVVRAFLLLASVIAEMSRARICAERISEVLQTKVQITWQPTTIGVPETVSQIELKNVTFKFADAEDNLLENISLVAKAGETTAFVGSTGSGKTTMASLFLRMYDPVDGEVLIDNVDIKNYAKSDLMQRIGYVPQKGILFSGTIADNIKFGAPFATPTEVEAAAKIARVDEFVDKLPEKYNSVVSQKGKNLSGGQKQRISIARALIKKPDIIIFDDAFSALDMKTDAEIRTELKHHLSNTVNIIIAQRISTIKDAEQIVVLENGKIVGKGKHLALLKHCKAYQEIVQSQYREEEFAKELALARNYREEVQNA